MHAVLMLRRDRIFGWELLLPFLAHYFLPSRRGIHLLHPKKKSHLCWAVTLGYKKDFPDKRAKGETSPYKLFLNGVATGEQNIHETETGQLQEPASIPEHPSSSMFRATTQQPFHALITQHLLGQLYLINE